jgi:hypothetical protein
VLHNYPDCVGRFVKREQFETVTMQCTECDKVVYAGDHIAALRENEMGTLLMQLREEGFRVRHNVMKNRLEGLA